MEYTDLVVALAAILTLPDHVFQNHCELTHCHIRVTTPEAERDRIVAAAVQSWWRWRGGYEHVYW